MRPVATYCRWKNALSAAWDLPFGLACLGAALGALPYAVLKGHPGQEHAPWGLLIAGVIPLLIGISCTLSGVKEARAAMADDGWFKAGPDGVAFRLPPDPERLLKWADVTRVYPRVRRFNGIPRDRKIVFETKSGEVTVPGLYFAESLDRIASNLADARGPAKNAG